MNKRKTPSAISVSKSNPQQQKTKIRKHNYPKGVKHKLSAEVIEERKQQTIVKLEKLYPNLYDYSKIDWWKKQEKQPVICKKHGTFYILIHNLLKGTCGCGACKGKKLQGPEKREKIKTEIIEVVNTKGEIEKIKVIL